MVAIAWVKTLGAVAVPSAPPDSLSSTAIRRDVANSTVFPPIQSVTPVVYGESPMSRTVYTIVSLVCMSLLTGMLGYRTRQIKIERRRLKELNLTNVLVFILYLLAIPFVLAAAVVESGLGLSTWSICHSAITLCLVFYLSSKMTMYLFLVERAHAMRAPYMRRSRDWIWVIGMLSITGGFGSIAISGFLYPIADLSKKDGRCRIGLPFHVTVPLLTFDVIINISLTGVFIYLLRPLLRFGSLSGSTLPVNVFTKGLCLMFKKGGEGSAAARTQNGSDLCPASRNFLKSIERLLWKTFIGSLLVMLPTVGNLAALCSLHGREFGWVCLTICTFDVTWAVCVIHWLTVGSLEVDKPVTVLVDPVSSLSRDGSSSVRGSATMP